MIYSDGEEDFVGFTYNPFNTRADSDDDGPVTQRQLKVLIENIGPLISSSRDSSSDAYSKASVEAFFQSLTKEHHANLDKANEAVSSSAALCGEMTTKMESLLSDAKEFMAKFQSSVESTTLLANKAIYGLNTTLRKEKEALVQVRTELLKENANFQASISAKITKLS